MKSWWYFFISDNEADALDDLFWEIEGRNLSDYVEHHLIDRKFIRVKVSDEFKFLAKLRFNIETLND